jgi:glycerophosphoryl diester phosphodiesterase
LSIHPSDSLLNVEPLIWAYGGDGHSAPIDTLPAYWGALAAGADGLALRVRLTADKQIVCSGESDLRATCGDRRTIDGITLAQLQKLDAGSQFVSVPLDAQNQPLRSKRGKSRPWKGDARGRVALYHPSLEEVLLLFGRRTRLLLILEPDRRRTSRRALVGEVCALLKRFGVERTTFVAGDAATLAVARKHCDVTLVQVCSSRESLASAGRSALEVGARTVFITLDRAVQRNGSPMAKFRRLNDSPLRFIIGPDDRSWAPAPRRLSALSTNGSVGGIACRAVEKAVDAVRPRCRVFHDPFTGPQLDARRWRTGYSRQNQDSRISTNKGFRISISPGGDYSGAAAVTAFSLRGAFDAQLGFHVANPEQGTTFELAAIQVDPSYGTENLAYDVHGAPPYASSERDENDGFRIGWNNGPALLGHLLHRASGTVLLDAPASDNHYNNYSRDVGEADEKNASGRIRLVRRDDIFAAYYTDAGNPSWVLSGTACVPTLCNDVFLRLGAKHWPKQGRTPPGNEIRFRDLQIYQRRT